ncbi:hypothetical protein D9613_008955 [Agrocybe pediades]|uniref:Uncharacterized protein n=1 Tax=Agrocybe pediades TaxID=84607 RepID=A0A8H4QU78_9AGAR|nr:hypothetical protein D9613_008955 [Agrocybe pediades]
MPSTSHHQHVVAGNDVFILPPPSSSDYKACLLHVSLLTSNNTRYPIQIPILGPQIQTSDLSTDPGIRWLSKLDGVPLPSTISSPSLSRIPHASESHGNCCRTTSERLPLRARSTFNEAIVGLIAPASSLRGMVEQMLR